ncbi:hypothetical protein D3C80_1747760 [compost metagenome]
MHQNIAAGMKLVRHIFDQVIGFSLFLLFHFPIKRSDGPGHVEQPVLRSYPFAYIPACAMWRTEEHRGFAGNFLHDGLHILDLFLYFAVRFIFQHNMIPAVITENAAAVVDQLQQLGMLLYPVAVHEKDSLRMMLIQRVDQ